MKEADLSAEGLREASILAQLITARADEIVRALAVTRPCRADEVQLIAAAIYASIIEDRHRRASGTRAVTPAGAGAGREYCPT